MEKMKMAKMEKMMVVNAEGCGLVKREHQEKERVSLL